MKTFYSFLRAAMAVCLLFCSGMVKADVIKTIGKTDNTTAYNGAHSDYYKLQKGETYHFVFKNYNAGNGSVWDNWMIVCANAEPNAAGYKESYRLRADKWNLTAGNNNGFGGNMGDYVGGNNGAIYDMYVEYTNDGKFKVDAILNKDYTENTWTYTGTADLGLDEITVYLTVEKAHIELYKATKETKAGIIQTIGNRNNKDVWANKASTAKQTISDGNAYHYVFDNYSSMEENWKNWVLGVTNSTGNDYYIVRADNYILDGSVKPANDLVVKTNDFSNDWAVNKAKMNASSVDLLVTYLNGTVTTKAVFTTSKGEEMNYTTTYGGITGNIQVYLSEEGAHLDIRKAEALTGANMTIGDAKTGTFCAPYAITLPAGVTAYTASVNGEWATMAQVAGEGEELAACTPVIVKSENAVDERFYGVSTTNDATCSSNDLVGILKAGQQLSSDASNTYYALQNGSEGLGFYVIGSNYSVKTNRAYLKTTSSQANIRMRFEEETGIKAVESTESDVMHNLSGLRVDSNYKGIVIKNGKKYLNK